MFTLGLNALPAGCHDAAACLVDAEGNVVAFVEEERLSRVKDDLRGAPVRAARWCLDFASVGPSDVSVVAIGWNVPMHLERWKLPRLKSRQILTQCVGNLWPLGSDLPEIVFVPHHLAHATASFFASGGDDAAVLVADGNGDNQSISLFSASRTTGVHERQTWPMATSIGWLYDAACQYLGYGFWEAGKVMGLAAYGRALGLEPWELIDLTGASEVFSTKIRPETDSYSDVTSEWLNLMTSYGGARPSTSSYVMDTDPRAVQAAWSAQAAVEEVMSALVQYARRTICTSSGLVCLSGGVAMNCSANGRLSEPIYVPPVPSDAGVALGAAWTVTPPKTSKDPLTPYLGPHPGDVPAGLTDELGLRVDALEMDLVCEAIANGRVGAVVEGRAEIGARALGHRSIIASAASTSMRDRVNERKGREHWRPLAPVALASRASSLWPPRPHLHRYMIGAVDATEMARATIPAAVHVDGTCRSQTLTEPSDEVRFVSHLMSRYSEPAVLNTSLNERGAPIVSSSLDALNAFRPLGLDFLVLAPDRIVTKSPQWWVD